MTENDNGVVKDSSDTWNNRLNNYIEEIDFLKDMLSQMIIYQGSNTPILIKINDRLDSLFKHCHNKMNKFCPTEIVKQQQYQIQLKELERSGIIRYGKRLNQYQEVVTYTKKSLIYFKFEELLSERETHMYDVMDMIGITSMEKVKSTRLM